MTTSTKPMTLSSKIPPVPKRALLRCSVTGVVEATVASYSALDCGLEFVEGGGQPERRCGVDGELVLPGVMEGGRYQFFDHVREGRCPVGDDLARVP